MFQEAIVELSRPALGPVADAVEITLEVINRKPVTSVTVTAPIKQSAAQQAVVNIPAADESQPTTTTTAEPGQRTVAPKTSQPVSRFDDFVKRVEDIFPTQKTEAPKPHSPNNWNYLQSYMQTKEYAKYWLGI